MKRETALEMISHACDSQPYTLVSLAPMEEGTPEEFWNAVIVTDAPCKSFLAPYGRLEIVEVVCPTSTIQLLIEDNK